MEEMLQWSNFNRGCDEEMLQWSNFNRGCDEQSANEIYVIV
jgi:hypothetical protein